jgi:PEP-CTERM motif-containing protein
MRNWLVCIATGLAILVGAGGARAVDTLLYSFEDLVPDGHGNPLAPDGFFGLGATVSQDMIGATHLLHSLKYDVGGAGFVGARTESVVPAALNNPPGADYILFDMDIPAAYAGSFADIGVTIFGHALNAVGGPQFGLQAQFAPTQSIAALGAGQHNDLRIDLTGATNPVTFANGQSFNQIFGPGANQLTVSSAFQFFISKNEGVPVTVYIDNVRVGSVPEPTTLGLMGLGLAALGMVRRRNCG